MEPLVWMLLGAVGLVGLAGYFRFRRLWRQLEETVADMAEGKRPATFVFSWSNSFARLGARLEEISSRSSRLRRQIEEDQFNLQAILSSMAEGLAVVDGDRVIRLVNDSFRRLFGLKGSPIGQTMLAAIREPTIEEMVKSALQSPGVHNREIPVIQPGKARRHLAISAVGTRDAAGLAVGAVVVFHDITELRQLEEVRREFVANVSHELRTPLAIFQGYIETLLEDAAMDRESVLGILSILQRHSKRLNAIVEDLLTLARLESTRIRIAPEPLDLARLAEGMAADWRRLFHDRGLRLDVAADGPLPEVAADPIRIEQVFNNLIDNAAKHTPRGGSVRLALSPLPGAVRVQVADTGMGIPASDLPFIFDRFYRVEKDRSRDTGGTGLGLSIVKRIVEMHGGKVEATSKAGAGTTITLELPSGTSRPATPEPLAQIPSTELAPGAMGVAR